MVKAAPRSRPRRRPLRAGTRRDRGQPPLVRAERPFAARLAVHRRGRGSTSASRDGSAALRPRRAARARARGSAARAAACGRAGRAPRLAAALPALAADLRVELGAPRSQRRHSALAPCHAARRSSATRATPCAALPVGLRHSSCLPSATVRSPVSARMLLTAGLTRKRAPRRTDHRSRTGHARSARAASEPARKGLELERARETRRAATSTGGAGASSPRASSSRRRSARRRRRSEELRRHGTSP